MAFYEKDEKSSKFLFNLEKHNYEKKLIHKLKLYENENFETDKPITFRETGTALSTCYSRYTWNQNRIFKFFWPDLKHYFLEMLDEIYDTKILTES